jgi:dUTP pyrophosphatase
MIPILKVKKLFPDAQLPVRANPTASGLDVFAHHFEKVYTKYGCRDLKESDSSLGFDGTQYVLEPNDRIFIASGLSVSIDPGFEIQVRPRSGLALKKGLSITNSPGTVDSDYRGPVNIIVTNTGHDRQTIKIGERIAQLVVAPVCLSEVVEVEELDSTDRGKDGFGSTGV